jgi:hypothetical protein
MIMAMSAHGHGASSPMREHGSDQAKSRGREFLSLFRSLRLTSMLLSAVPAAVTVRIPPPISA